MEKTEDILAWIQELNTTTEVKIQKNKLSDSGFWHYDEETGQIHNKDYSFFSIAGIRGNVNGVAVEQPIFIQSEIGYLGILCKDFNKERHYLMQAKIEPGNINCVQISPTIQATKSNFMQKHGGAKPLYLDYFLHAENYTILCDQIQSEQSARFYRKRNRNMILLLDENEDVVVEKRFKWMTLSQIKELMKYRNLVNMDTRTVLSNLPLIREMQGIKEQAFLKSVTYDGYVEEIVEIYHAMNNYKMFHDHHSELIRLDEMKNWDIQDEGIVCRDEFPYKVIFCEIEIEGREVRKWSQPLFEANGVAIFGLISTIQDGVRKFLVHIIPEIGCFDTIEVGPTIQKEAPASFEQNEIEKLFEINLKTNTGILFDSILSEEGGRFYHEENRNILMEIPYGQLPKLPNGYFLVSYAALNHMNLINNCLNIQLRNLLSTWEV